MATDKNIGRTILCLTVSLARWHEHNMCATVHCEDGILLHITEEPEEDSEDALDRDAMPARRKKKQARCMYVCMCVRDHVDNWVNHKMDAPSTATAKVVVPCRNVL